MPFISPATISWPAGSLARARSSSQEGTLVRPIPWFLIVQVTSSGRPLPAGCGTAIDVTTRSAYGIGITSKWFGSSPTLAVLRPFIEDRVAGVGLDEQVVAPAEARRHGERLGLGVALVDGQAAGMDERAQHDRVGVVNVVGRRRDDRVGPGGRLAGTRADVRDRPGDRGIGRVADRLRRGGDVADRQVGIGGDRDVDRLAGRVRRAARLDELVGRVGDDDDLVGAAVPQRDGRAGGASRCSERGPAARRSRPCPAGTSCSSPGRWSRGRRCRPSRRASARCRRWSWSTSPSGSCRTSRPSGPRGSSARGRRGRTSSGWGAADWLLARSGSVATTSPESATTMTW